MRQVQQIQAGVIFQLHLLTRMNKLPQCANSVDRRGKHFTYGDPSRSGCADPVARKGDMAWLRLGRPPQPPKERSSDRATPASAYGAWGANRQERTRTRGQRPQKCSEVFCGLALEASNPRGGVCLCDFFLHAVHLSIEISCSRGVGFSHYGVFSPRSLCELLLGICVQSIGLAGLVAY